MQTKTKWEKFHHNEVLKGKEFYISFNPDTNSDSWTARMNSLGSMLGGLDSSGQPETALVKDRKFYILNGDFRKEYEKLFQKGFQACYDFYLSKPELKSNWSND